MNDETSPNPRAPRSHADVLAIREFEGMLRARGAGRNEAKRATHELRPETMRAMLPLWRRALVAWRARG